MNAVSQVTIDDVALNRELVHATGHTFSHVLDDWKITDQKQTGRCWMFAALNLFRAGAMRKMGLKEFEFSQSYPLFWDKVERSNYFLEATIETAHRPLDDRTVAFLLESPLEDGGQWDMFVALVRKHGVVPKAAMPETESSSNTRRMNEILRYKLREGARNLRARSAAGATVEELRAIKEELLGVVYRILCIHLGTPPERIQWQWTDTDGEFHRGPVMTPQEFAAEYITIPLDDYVCLVHDPRPTSPLGRTYTVEYLGNIVGEKIVTYLNIDCALMKEIAKRTIVEGREPVWFGCDTGKMVRHDLGLWDRELYDYASLYGTSFALDKAERLDYHQSLMTHAMILTGVDLVDGEPRRWRVENSAGDKYGREGFYTLNDNWFAEHVFEIAARKDYLPANLRAALDLEPNVLPAWDPMGALARVL